jgi:hypothetical protein
MFISIVVFGVGETRMWGSGLEIIRLHQNKVVFRMLRTWGIMSNLENNNATRDVSPDGASGTNPNGTPDIIGTLCLGKRPKNAVPHHVWHELWPYTCKATRPPA